MLDVFCKTFMTCGPEVGWLVHRLDRQLIRFLGPSTVDDLPALREGLVGSPTHLHCIRVIPVHGQRRSDVVRMAWTDIAGDANKVVQLKTGARLTIRLHLELQEILRHWPRSHIAILTTKFGKPFSVAGFGNMMADAIKAAGLPERCVPHGLRKAAARRLAEVGCSEKQITAVTGHTTLKEVARYTRAANQERLAADAVDMLAEQKTLKNSQTSIDGLGKRKKS